MTTLESTWAIYLLETVQRQGPPEKGVCVCGVTLKTDKPILKQGKHNISSPAIENIHGSTARVHFIHRYYNQQRPPFCSQGSR